MARAKCGGGLALCDGQHIYSYPHPYTLPFVNLIRTFVRASPSVWLLIFLVLLILRQKEHQIHMQRVFYKAIIAKK